MFTIEVKKRREDEEFSFKDLEMFHRECKGGRIKQEPYEEITPSSGFNFKKKVEDFPSLGNQERGSGKVDVKRTIWMLTCQRCGVSTEVGVAPWHEATEVIATVIDGQKRTIGGYTTVIQKP